MQKLQMWKAGMCQQVDVSVCRWADMNSGAEDPNRRVRLQQVLGCQTGPSRERHEQGVKRKPDNS